VGEFSYTKTNRKKSILSVLLSKLIFYASDVSLQKLKEFSGVRSVHLSVVELERDGDCCPKKAAAVFSPNHKRIVEDSAVHAHRAVNFRVDYGGSSNHHALRKVVIPASLGNLACQLKVVAVEFLDVVIERHIARAYLAGFVLNNCVHGKRIVLKKLSAHWKQKKFLHPAGGFSHAPAQKHIEFEFAAVAQPYKRRNVQRLEKSDHRIGRVHPKLKSLRPRSRIRVN